MPDNASILIGLDAAGAPVNIPLSDAARHMFICGSTGSGKTSLLLGQVANVLAMGSGCLFVDGKGDRAALNGIATIAKRYGREEDLFVLDFTGKMSRDGAKRSHTVNPFQGTSLNSMRDMIVSLMGEIGGHDSMWQGRAIAMLGGLLRVLAELRDQGVMDLDVHHIRDSMNLRRLIDLADKDKYPTLPRRVRAALNSYLISLPGYVAEKGYKQAQTTLDQHGYLEMQFTRIFGAMADDYRDVFCEGPGEIDLGDIVRNKRILVVLLPTTSRSADEVAFLGNVVLTMLKDLMATLALSIGPTAAAPPFSVFLDEFGQYTLEGFDSVVALARSLGLSLVFSTQSLLPSGCDRTGAVLDHVLANTAVKILMRTDLFDRDRLAKIAPLENRAAIREADDRLERLSNMVLMRQSAGALPAAIAPLVDEYEGLLARRDALTQASSESDLRAVLPKLAAGEMAIVKNGVVTRARAFDMSALYSSAGLKLREDVAIGTPIGNAPSDLPPPIEFSSKSVLDPKERWLEPHERRTIVFGLVARAISGSPTPQKELGPAIRFPEDVLAVLRQNADATDSRDAVRRAVAACYLMGEAQRKEKTNA